MSTVYDRQRLVELFGDDPSTLAEIEREFLDTARGAEREIRDTDDLLTIARAAHQVKGASGMIGATALSEVAAAVERAAKAQDLPAVRRLDDSFHHEVTKIATLMSGPG
jgi:HPt (histidine-containing phosphotransfer) domain-containing protein